MIHQTLLNWRARTYYYVSVEVVDLCEPETPHEVTRRGIRRTRGYTNWNIVDPKRYQLILAEVEQCKHEVTRTYLQCIQDLI